MELNNLLILTGTLPIENLPLTQGYLKFKNKQFIIDDLILSKELISLGTASMILTAAKTCQTLNLNPPYVITAGDLGDGSGSELIYNLLTNNLQNLSPDVLTIHYILPRRLDFEKFISSLNKCDKKPVMIADAGALLIAKATKTCSKFDLFTPDAGELGFLSDPEADHPAYVQYPVFKNDDKNVSNLINQSYINNNSPSHLLVKGPIDYISKNGEILDTVKEPNIPTLESIGGTGDTLTGIVSALIYSGLNITQSSILAAKTNRIAGKLANPTPATKISEIISHIPKALSIVLNN